MVLCKARWMGIILKALNIFLFLILFNNIFCGKMLKQSTGLIWLIYHFRYDVNLLYVEVHGCAKLHIF